MAFACFLTRTAEGYVLVDCAVVTDNRGFTDDNAHSVVNKQTLADFCARVNFDTRFVAASLGNPAGYELVIMIKKPVCAAVTADCLKARVEEENLCLAPCGRVAVQNRLNI